MILIFGITLFLMVVYLLYPLWLIVSASAKHDHLEEGKIESVSLVLLSYNGKKYLESKIEFLLEELSFFRDFELIIVDDKSRDGTSELLEQYRNDPRIKILIKEHRRGIPDSMNRAINIAKYPYVIFCDQRQVLSEKILQLITGPLIRTDTGAVSGCISETDKEHNCSFTRCHENFLKMKEGHLGSLIGVYGPFYAIKKECYHTIPDYIILDDLYLSLRILKNKRIVLKKNCNITDENSIRLYDYKRARKYLSGLLQLLNEKSLIRDLNMKQKMMLFWHKYLRLLIRVFMAFSYFASGCMVDEGPEYLVLFIVLTLLAIFSLLPYHIKGLESIKNLGRIMIFYFIASLELIFRKTLSYDKKIVAETNNYGEPGSKRNK